MAEIHLRSVAEPLATPPLARAALTALTRAEAMGLLPRTHRIETLDLAVLDRLLEFVRRAGIGRTLDLAFVGEPAARPAHLERVLERLNEALEDSPVPDCEWERLAGVLGAESLARLVGISLSSVRRYRASARTTPDDVAGRLHFLALVVGDLSGAYNDAGIRQWFDRKRGQLGGRAPAELLAGDWKPAGPGPRRVRELARALAASPAT
jgi:hypothetical protein